ncbi:DUF3828 domain-containing protein [Novosphingobium sp. B 225]|uniref:DUF3828 domain-containing protein n=1 Tax=Novosphingobium sp. B 225 TaxID=1961849 RepID=UPI000B4A7D91|nr:DUF3828 domain-containing protein [Novosphingobium sp. B 225]
MNALHRLALALAPLALIAAAPAGPAPAQVDAVLLKAYGGYKSDADNGPADWQKPVYSAEVTTLIKTWDKHTGENLTALSDYSWFCDCQDWDAQKFRWTRLSLRSLGPNRAEVKVRVNAGWGSASLQRLILVRQGGRWLIDDLFSDSVPTGIKATLRQELKEKPGE